MPRRGEDVRDRLQQAALELFGAHGFDRTTSAEIAAQAGVTERTFFRHFADKREVLFDGQAKLQAAFVDGVAAAPSALGPLDTLLDVFRSLVPQIEANRSFAEPRQRVIAATSALRERELAKYAVLTVALAGALKARGVEQRLAMLAAQAGMAAFVQATLAWFEAPQQSLGEHLDQSFQTLRQLTA